MTPDRCQYVPDTTIRVLGQQHGAYHHLSNLQQPQKSCGLRKCWLRQKRGMLKYGAQRECRCGTWLTGDTGGASIDAYDTADTADVAGTAGSNLIGRL
jgi:hypothetical protein